MLMILGKIFGQLLSDDVNVLNEVIKKKIDVSVVFYEFSMVC